MGKMATNQYVPDYLVTPGEVLEDYLESLHMSQADLAARTGLAKKTINEIIKGKSPITTETALKFERALRRPAHFWSNLESRYQEDCTRINEKERLEADLHWLKVVPINDMAKLGWVEKLNDKHRQLETILQFFGIASVDRWDTVWGDYQVAFRQTQSQKRNVVAISAWLRRGELEAQQIYCEPFDRSRFQEVLKEVRALTTDPPQVFQPKLEELCASAGVAVVFVPGLPKTGVYGATRWIGAGPGKKAVVQLSLLYKTNDHLWFTFFHEAGHILKHGRREIFIEANGCTEEKENEANAFARNSLIPPKDYARFLASWDCRSHQPISAFAATIGIAPGIVVGRLQHDKHLPHSHGNKLKVRYKWESTP